MKDNKLVWEIMVPTVRTNGKPYRTRHHREWDKRVRRISGGLTIHPVSKGQWISEGTGEVYVERMIPVRIVATREQMDEIIDITLNHYSDQEAVLAAVVSTEYILKYREKKLPKKKIILLDHNGEVHIDQFWIPKGLKGTDQMVQVTKSASGRIGYRVVNGGNECAVFKQQFLDNFDLLG